MYTVLPAEYAKARTLFSSAPFFSIIGAVFDQTQKGWVILDRRDSPNWCLAVHSFGFAQLVLCGGQCPDIELLLSWLSGSVPLSDAGELPARIRLYAPPQALLDEILRSAPRGVALCEREQLRPGTSSVPPRLPPAGVLVRSVCQADLPAIDQVFGLQLGARFWPSQDAFLQYSSGSLVVSSANAELLSICYSAALSAGVAEIDIITAKGQTRKGYARLAAEDFLRRCRQNKVIPNWDCYTNNIPSRELANALGFHRTLVYPFIVFDRSV